LLWVRRSAGSCAGRIAGSSQKRIGPHQACDDAQ
jgi:hypothetical protein